MASKTVDVILRLRDDASDALEDVADAAKEADENTEGLTTSMIKAEVVMSAVTTAVNALVNVLQETVIGAIRTGAQFETFEARLATFLGTTQLAKERLSELFIIASTTPFELDQVVAADAQLEAFGLSVEDWRLAVMDLSGAMGIGLVDAANAVGKAFVGGAGAADVLRERGVLAMLELRTGMKATELTTGEFRQALLDTLTDPDGRIAGGTAKLAATFEGRVSNMSDAWTRFQKTIADAGLFDAAKESLERILTLLEDNQEGVEALATTIGEDFAQAIREATDAIVVITEAFGPMVSVFQKLKSVGDVLRFTTLTGLIAKFNELWLITTATTDVTDLFHPSIENLNRALSEQDKRQQSLDESARSAFAAMGEAASAAEKAAEALDKIETPELFEEDVIGTLTAAADALRDLAGGSEDAAIAALQLAVAEIQLGVATGDLNIDQAAGAVRELVDAFGDFSATNAEALSGIIDTGGAVRALDDALLSLGVGVGVPLGALDALTFAEIQLDSAFAQGIITLEEYEARLLAIANATAAIEAPGLDFSGLDLAGAAASGDIQALLATAGGTAGPLGELAVAGMNTLITVGQEGAEGIQESITEFQDDLTTGLEEIPEVIENLIPQLLGEVLPAFVGALVASAPALFASLTRANLDLAKFILFELPTILPEAIASALTEWGVELFERLQGFVQDIRDEGLLVVLTNADEVATKIARGLLAIITLGLSEIAIAVVQGIADAIGFGGGDDGSIIGGESGLLSSAGILGLENIPILAEGSRFLSNDGLIFGHQGEEVVARGDRASGTSGGRGGGPSGTTINLSALAIDPNTVQNLARMLEIELGGFGRMPSGLLTS